MIHFDSHEFSGLNYKSYEKDKSSKRFLRDLEDSMSVITMAKRCGVPEWKIKKLIENFKLGKRKLIKKVIVQPDTHVPYEDKAAVKVFKKFCKKYEPDIFVHLGDWDDVDSLSRWNEHKKRKVDFGQRYEEMKSLKAEVKSTEDILPGGCKKIYTMGNHEMRVWAYYLKHPQSIGCMDLKDWMTDKGWMVYPEGKLAIVGNLHFTHNTYTNLHACAKSCDYGLDMVFGHLHTWQVYTKMIAGKRVTTICGGHLADVQHCHESYMRGKPLKWHQGFLTCEIDILTGQWSVKFNSIEDGKLIGV